jgi:hypothetical protein
MALLDRIGKPDRGGGPFYNTFDRIRVEKVYTDTIHKEKSMTVFSPYFNMNLVRPLPAAPSIKFSHNRMETTTEKIQHKSPSERMSDVGGPDEDDYEMHCIRHTMKGPTHRWDMASTTSHDIGWLVSHPPHARKLRSLGGLHNVTMPQLKKGEWNTPMARTCSDPGVLNPMLESLNSRRWHKHGNQKSDVHEYAENYYMCMGANPFQKTQPLGRSL